MSATFRTRGRRSSKAVPSAPSSPKRRTPHHARRPWSTAPTRFTLVSRVGVTALLLPLPLFTIPDSPFTNDRRQHSVGGRSALGLLDEPAPRRRDSGSDRAGLAR